MRIKKKIEKIDKLNNNLTKENIEDFAYVFGSKKEIFKRNFLAGISRGVGIAIGVTLVTAILIYTLQRIVRLNIPLIGKYIVDIVEIVEKKQY